VTGFVAPLGETNSSSLHCCSPAPIVHDSSFAIDDLQEWPSSDASLTRLSLAMVTTVTPLRVNDEETDV
jgi:hypothetical protein